MTTEEMLAKVPMFQDLPKKSLDRIAKFVRARNFQAGDVIFKEGEEKSAAEGHFIHVYVDRATRRPVSLPDALRAALERILA